MSSYDLVIKNPNKGPNVSNIEENAVRRLADYAVATQIRDLPAEVLDHARRILLDTIGVTLGGCGAAEVTAMAHRLGKPNGGPSSIIGHALRSSKFNAALVNGTAATWLDYDSGHRPPPGKPLLLAAHPPIHVVPALLAAGESVAASGAETLVALVVGYDVGSRIGMGSRVRAGIHCHGTHNNTGAAVAAARLGGADIKQMEKTIGLAVHLTLMPSSQNAYQGRTVRNTYAAVGSALGILASELAMANFSPEYDALGSVFGEVISPWLDPQRITDQLGSRFEITQGFMKRHPMCRMVHPALEAAEGLVQQHKIVPEDVDTIEIRTYDLAATCYERAPRTELAAKFSIPWAVACMLVRKSAGMAEFAEEALADGRVRAVAAQVAVVEDSRYTDMAQDGLRRPASITVRTKTGHVFSWEVERNTGGPDSPLPTRQILNKFHSLADPVIGPSRAETVSDMVMHLQELPNIRELIRLLIPVKSA